MRALTLLVVLFAAATQACATPAGVVCPEAPPRAAQASGVCWAKGRPRPLTPAPKPDKRPFCNALDAEEVARVEARIHADFVVRESPSKLIIDFGCDVAREPREVVLETGSGHGGTLRIVRFQAGADGTIVVRRILRSQYYDAKTTVARAETTATTLDAVVAKSRVALLARPHLVRLAVPNGPLHLPSISTSSNDFHLLLRIEDAEARVTERRFTGYESSAEQEAILPMRLATEPLVKLVDALPFVDDAPTDEDRAFVTARFRATMAGAPAWWIRERYVALVQSLGTADAIPALVALVREQGDASSARTREASVEAIARVTGWDPRVDERGRKRPFDEIARMIAVECAP